MLLVGSFFKKNSLKESFEKEKNSEGVRFLASSALGDIDEHCVSTDLKAFFNFVNGQFMFSRINSSLMLKVRPKWYLIGVWTLQWPFDPRDNLILGNIKRP